MSETINHDHEGKEIRKSAEAIAFSTPIFNACFTLCHINKKLDPNKLIEEHKKKFDTVISDDPKDIEALLYFQAITLDALFHEMIRQALNSEHVDKLVALSDLAARMQKQSRQTLTALADIRNPKRATFIKQQNNAINQQINSESNFKNFEKNSSNELLKEIKNETMDNGGALETVFAHPEMETVGEIQRTQDS